MTLPDFYENDLDVREAIHALAPEVDMIFDRIEQRAAGIRRRAHRRIAAAIVAITLLGIGAAVALPGSHAHGAVDVDHPGRTHQRARGITSPTSAPSRANDNGSPSQPNIELKSPREGSHPVEVVIPGETPSKSPVSLPHHDATSPTTAPHDSTSPTTAPARESTTTTTVPIYDVPPIAPGHTRMTVTLDDTGLHAPEFVAMGDAVEVLFLDQRTVRPAKPAYLFSTALTGSQPMIFVARWNPTPYPHIVSIPIHHTSTIELSVQDTSCDCTLQWHATVTIGAGS